ncbi:MAB_1171c family putative transporter [Spongiactinospora rosea]|uniref:MAB_1171c family putative transporter n=1 Tax=Spongiactinospora rosea TaxID=2248750 RepID=UPI0026C234CC
MVGALIALLYTLPRLVHSSINVATIAILVYFACSFLSFFLGLEFVWPHLARLFGYNNITTILIHCIVVILTAAQQVVLIYWLYAPSLARGKALRRVACFGAALVSLIALFLLALPTRRYDAETASLLNMQNPRYAAYLCAYIAVVAVGQIVTIRMSIRFSGIARRSWLRRGMRIVAVGAAFILLYCAARYLEVIGVQHGADMARWDQLQWLVGDLGSLLELVGWTIPRWGPRLSHIHHWMADYRAYCRLYPLWAVLYKATPSIAKEPPYSPAGSLRPRRDIEYHLYRRVIEIQDGRLALRPFLHQHEAKEAQRQARDSGLEGEALQVAIEALQLRAALYSRARQSMAPGPISTAAMTPEGNLREQVRWLTMVSQAYVRTRRGKAGAFPRSAAGASGP